jgi:LmbE family N-acetylglucosaminyl deacetylase
VEDLARHMEHPIQGKTVLVVVAHPDDAEAFCGGPLAKVEGQKTGLSWLSGPTAIVAAMTRAFVQRSSRRYAAENSALHRKFWASGTRCI